MTPRRTRAVLSLGLVVVAGSAVAAPRAQAVSPAPAGTLELVLDASGSMAGADPAGGTKIDAARAALAGVLGRLPAGTSVGVRAYGGTYDDQERGCSDTRLVVPVGPVVPAAAASALSGLKPVGYTPLAASLKAAAADLPAGRPRTIVLVSDGEETCGGDPCAVARELAEDGVDLTIDTVGYGVDERTRAQLTCIATATGGDYSEAPDGDALTVQLAQVTTSGLRRYEPTGTRVTGSADPLGAPLVGPGQYVDALDPGERSYYALDLTDGVTPYVAATLVHPPGPVAGSTYDNVTVAMYGLDGKKCGSVSEGTGQNNGGTASTVVATPGVVGANWSVGAFSSSTGNCGPAGRYTFSVERDDNGKGQAALPLELRVLEEPPPVSTSSLPAAPPNLPSALTPPELSAPLTPVTGGGSYTTAAQLQPGSSVDTIRPGETVYYRVPVGWNQRLAFTATIPPLQPGTATTLPSTLLAAYVAGPTRQEVTLLSGATTSTYFSSYDDDGASVSGSTAPVLFRNRDVREAALQSESLAGDHYLVVQLGASSTPSDVALPLRLGITVTGDKTGAPDYGKASLDAGTTEGSSDTQASGGGSGSASDDGVPWRTVGYTGGGVAALAVAGALLLGPALRLRRRPRA